MTTECFVLSEWAPLEQGYGRGSGVTAVLMPHEAHQSRQQEVLSVLQSSGQVISPQLFWLHANRWQVVGDDDLLAAAVRAVEPEPQQYPSQLTINGAGLEGVNGTYERRGSHNERPRWMLLSDERSVFLRGGSDGNWCIVNNEGGALQNGQARKEFYYTNAAEDLFAAGWSVDTHGAPPGPSAVPSGPMEPFIPPERAPVAAQSAPMMFRMALEQSAKRAAEGTQGASQPSVAVRILLAIARHGSALIAAPPLPEGRRPIALHLHHFHDDTTLWAAAGAVTDDSFGGLDDEAIRCEGVNGAGEVWSYVGK